MSVIAKMSIGVVDVQSFGRNLNFHCVYDTDLAKEENEDVRFTKATPWGECKATVKNSALPFEQHKTYFLLFDPLADKPSFDGAIAAVRVVCHAVTSFSGTSRHVELHGDWISKGEDDGIPGALRLDENTVSINIKMAIDNPGASLQFEPGAKYWLSFYSAEDKGMEDVLAIAR